MVGEGLSNKQIADVLITSGRTVGGHIYCTVRETGHHRQRRTR